MNTAFIIRWGSVLLWSIAASGMTWYGMSVARQISYVTLADGRQEIRMLPWLMRLLIPFTPNLNPFFSKPAFKPVRDKIDGKLVSAGYDGVVTPVEFLSLKVLMPIFMGPLWIAMIKMALSTTSNALLLKMEFPLCLIGPALLLIYPDQWLRYALQQRHSQIQRSLPFVLDLLTLSVEAGMDFMTALQRNISERKVDALGEELIRVIRQIQLGKSRREALRDMSARVNLSDLRAVVGALVQADELGVSIGSILRIQADQMRQRRFERAERLANEAPVKMLFPLMMFIFPSVFLVLMGPIVVRLIAQGF